jgi:hypothetical protein
MSNSVKTSLLSLTAVSIAISLAACGGGGGGSAAPRTFNGNVIDGYITGATVCLDENNNLLCDADEFSAVTQAAVPGETGFKGKDGWYTFTVTRAIVPGTQVVADIPAGAVDSDLGEIKKPFKMLAPVDKPEVISPLTTLVSITMKNSGGATDSVQAEKEVKASLGMSESDKLLGKDFIADKDETLTNTAIVTASFIKDATKAVEDAVKKDKDANNETLDAAQTAKASLQQALAAVKQQKSSGALDTVIASVKTQREQGNKISEESVTEAKADAGINVATVISGNWQDIQSQTKSGDGSVVKLANLSGEIMILESNNERLDKDDDPTNNRTLDTDGDPTTKSYLRWLNDDGSEGRFSRWVEGFTAEWFYSPEKIIEGKLYKNTQAGFSRFLIPDNYEINRRTNPTLERKWYPVVENNTNPIFVGGSSWVDQSELQFKIEDNCFVETHGEQEVMRYCFVEKDFTGRKLEELTPEICLDDNDATIAGCDKETVLTPTGSQQFKVYDLTLTVGENSANGMYRHWGESGYMDEKTKEDASLEHFLQNIAYSESTGILRGSHSRGDGDCSNVHFVADVASLVDDAGNKVDFGDLGQNNNEAWTSFKAKGVKVAKGDLLWVDARQKENDCAWPGNDPVLKLIKAGDYERTPFTISEIGGKRVMKFISPKNYRAKNPGSDDSYLLFVENEVDYDGDKYFTVAGGEFDPSNYKRELFFTGNFDRTTLISTDLFKFLLEKRGEKPFPFEQAEGFFK